MGIATILWEKWVEFRGDFYKITVAAMIAPLLYLLVFGLGIQTMSHGRPYLQYLIPGVVALTTMNASFGAIARNMNVQRMYERAFDRVMISPTPLWRFVVGQVVAGALRGIYAGCVILPLPFSAGTAFAGGSDDRGLTGGGANTRLHIPIMDSEDAALPLSGDEEPLFPIRFMPKTELRAGLPFQNMSACPLSR